MTVEPQKTPNAVSLPSSTGALIVWLGIQLAVMLLAAFQVPLAAVYPQPAERLAPQLLLATQVASTSLLFPYLLKDCRHTVQIVATALPFQIAAAFLAGLSPRVLLPVIGFVGAWIATLALWRASLPSTRLHLVGVCVAGGLTLGNGVFEYLRLEFGEHTRTENGFETVLPLFTTVASADGASIPPRAWLVVAGLAALAASILLLRRFLQTRRTATPKTA